MAHLAPLLTLLTLIPSGQQELAQEATAEAFHRFCAEVESTIANGDPKTLQNAFNVDRLAEIMRGGMADSGKGMDAYFEGFKAGFKRSNSLALDIIESNEVNAGTYVFLRMMPDEPSHALFRWAGDDGLEYHQLALEVNDDGAVQVVDLLGMSFGEWTSVSSRQHLEDAAAQSQQGLWARLTRKGPDFVESLVKVGRMVELIAEEPEKALELFDELPESLQQRMSVQRIRISAASEIDDETYIAALNDFARIHPDSPALPLMMIDAHILTNNAKEALASVDQLDKAIHSDPYLDILRAQIYRQFESYPEAREHLRSACERDERLEEAAAWEYLEVALCRNNHKQTLRRLMWLYENSEWYVGDTSDLEAYAAFNKSEFGQRWAKFLKKMDTEKMDTEKMDPEEMKKVD